VDEYDLPQVDVELQRQVCGCCTHPVIRRGRVIRRGSRHAVYYALGPSR
jgi:hypothetical protein